MENLLNRITLTRKFLILGLLAAVFVAFPTQQNLRSTQLEAEAAQLKASGIAPLKSLMRVVQLAQQHRGMSAAFLGGNASFADARAAKQAELDQALDKMAALIQRELATGAIATAWTPAAKEWKELARAVAGKSLAAKESFGRHTAMIAQFIGVLDRMMDHYGLASNADIAGAEILQRPLPCRLRLVAVNGFRRNVDLGQVLDHAVGAVLGAGEDQGTIDCLVLQQLGQQLALRRTVHEHDTLLDPVDGRGDRGHRHLDRVRQH